ncbi:MAG: hypothetical protein Q4D98_03045 [Planctomycetia bacterium]|nr:hypothetical protein [Planctomycetia bacterium]
MRKEKAPPRVPTGPDFADEKPIPKDVITDSDGEWVVYNLAQEECWRPLGSATSFIRIHCRK